MKFYTEALKFNKGITMLSNKKVTTSWLQSVVGIVITVAAILTRWSSLTVLMTQ